MPTRAPSVSGHVTYMYLLIFLHMKPYKNRYACCHPCFIDKETKTETLSKYSKAAHGRSAKSRIWSEAIWFSALESYFPLYTYSRTFLSTWQEEFHNWFANRPSSVTLSVIITHGMWSKIFRVALQRETFQISDSRLLAFIWVFAVTILGPVHWLILSFIQHVFIKSFSCARSCSGYGQHS